VANLLGQTVVDKYQYIKVTFSSQQWQVSIH